MAMILRTLLVTALFATIPFAEADESTMPAATSVDGRELVLNGKALRSVWGFKVYEVGLFIGERNEDADDIMGNDRAAKRVQMNMLRAVDKDKFVATVRENIDGNFSAEEKEKFASELEAFVSYLQNGGDIAPGQTITIDYHPGKGTVLGLDGRHVGTIPGDDFYHRILRLWIGKPLQDSIKTGLLGAEGED